MSSGVEGGLPARLADPARVRAQYRDATRLDARTSLYARFAKGEEPWYRWLFARLAPGAGERVLDAGCGTGGLWGENADRLPPGLELGLVDRSAGMLGEARRRLAGPGAAPGGCVADLRSLPFPDRSFDLVMANHVLYHVPDRAAALRELRRVCRPGGRVAVATNDSTHLAEMRELASRFGVAGAFAGVGREPGVFDLEAAQRELGAALGPAKLHRRRVTLAVTEAGAVADYLGSLCEGDDAGARLRALRGHLEARIRRAGVWETAACAGVVVAERRAEPQTERKS